MAFFTDSHYNHGLSNQLSSFFLNMLIYNQLSYFVQANLTRDAFAKALYCRTVSAILKRANSLKRPSISSLLSDSTESNIHQGRICYQQDKIMQ